MLSLFYASLLLAAGSNASPCKLQSGNWTSSSTTGSKAALHRDGHGSAAVNQNQKLGAQANSGLNLVQPSPSQSSTSPSNAGPSTAPSDSSGSSGGSGGSGTSGTSDISGSLTPASGSCPQGFLNTVFNTNAGQSSGFPGATWKTLTSYGINEWSTLAHAVPKPYLRLY